MNIAAHQKSEDEMGKKESEDERKQSINFKEGACCLSAHSACPKFLLNRRLYSKKMVCMKGVPRVTRTLGKANSHFNPNGVG